MDGKHSRAALIDFLDYVSQKGLVPSSTAQSRKAAVGKVLGVLSDDEAHDVRGIDLDSTMTRFHNLHGKSYTPDSLATYKSRVRTALDDFASYIENPLAFKPSAQNRERKTQVSGGGSGGGKTTKDRTQDQPTKTAASLPMVSGPMASSILPIPIRVDLTVMIQGLPYDLTAAEAKKIAGVIQAMAISE